MNSLENSVVAWRQSIESVLELLAELPADEWSKPSDCPGWSVKDLVAHLAHLEHELASDTTTPAAESKTLASSFTEAGVLARRDRTADELIAELRAAAAVRAARLTVLPGDPQALASPTPGGVAWSWDTLLRNRAIDAWVHEQDIRRATGRPGNLDSPGAQLTTQSFKAAMTYVVGKKVRPPAGSSIGWQVNGDIPFELTALMGADGRASVTEAGTEPTVLLTMSSEDFAILGAGRRTPDRLDIGIAGDTALAQTVLTAMTVTF